MNRVDEPVLQQNDALARVARNQAWLAARLAWWRERIEQGASAEASPPPTTDDGFEPAAWHLRDLFGLSTFEAELLLLAAGLEIDAPLRAAVARAQGMGLDDAVRLRFSLALALLPEAHWDALSPSRPLRHWALLDVNTESGLSHAPLRADERVLHFLTGVAACDERLNGVCAHEANDPTADEDTYADTIAAAMAPLRRALVLLPSATRDAASKRHARALACAAFARLGMRTLRVDAAAVQSQAFADARELVALARRIDREAALTHAGITISIDSTEAGGAAALVRLIAALRGPVCVLGGLSSMQLAELPARRVLRFNAPVPQPDASEAVAVHLRPALQRALQQFRVEPALIEQAVDAAAGIDDAVAAERCLWSQLRIAARGDLDALAQRITSRSGFGDLVLPPFVAAQLREIVGQLRQRRTVHEEWGMGEPEGRGLGIAVLFAGESGTGKTLAAEVIANELQLDLYRIDLASVVSKYIGETEKNLARLFDAAERSGAVLLFDEADALFGKRSEVKDSHDRYANIEVAYLLQRIESYRGLAVLTTNLKSALDRAFLRRIRFVVQFPLPDEAAREQLWRRQFPARAPLGDVDFTRLARLQLAGGNIRSIALNAAFRAADRGGPIDHGTVIEAARAEFMKLERTFNPTDRGGA